MRSGKLFILPGLAALTCASMLLAQETPTVPAYQIVLRSRVAEATPMRSREAQTGGGRITVEQPERNTIVVTMGGSAVVGSDYRASAAGIQFHLDQELEIFPTQANVRPPRVGMLGRVVGTLQVTDPGKCGKACGAAEQGPATASLSYGSANLLSLAVRPAAATASQETFINFREGPVESPAAAGSYRLNASFNLGATQGKGVFHRQYAVADFDPAPKLDAFWVDALRPFRAVAREDFGFQLILRVVEEPTAPAPKAN